MSTIRQDCDFCEMGGPVPSANRYYIRTKTQRRGPFSATRLARLVDSGRVPKETRVLDGETGKILTIGSILDNRTERQSSTRNGGAREIKSETGRAEDARPTRTSKPRSTDGKTRATATADADGEASTRTSKPTRRRRIGSTRMRTRRGRRQPSRDTLEDAQDSSPRAPWWKSSWLKYGAMFILALGFFVYTEYSDSEDNARLANEAKQLVIKEFSKFSDDPGYIRFLVEHYHEDAVRSANERRKVSRRTSRTFFDSKKYARSVARSVRMTLDLGDRSPMWRRYRQR